MENVATVQAEIDAREARDEAAYLSSLADDVEVYSPERDEPERARPPRERTTRPSTRRRSDGHDGA